MSSRAKQQVKTPTRGLALVQQGDRVEAALWRRAQDGKDTEARTQLFEHFQPLAKKIAAAEFGRRKDLGFELAELQQLAFEGLLQAIKNYDAAMRTPFPAFARRRIRGNIIDGLSRTNERSAQFHFRQRAERDRLRSLQTDKKESSDPLKELGRLTTLLAIGLMIKDSTDINPEQIATQEASAYDTLVWVEMQQRLVSQVEKLGERERFVLLQHYRDEVSFSQIAEILGVTKGRISQIHKSALLRLRAELQRYR